MIDRYTDTLSFVMHVLIRNLVSLYPAYVVMYFIFTLELLDKGVLTVN